MGLSDLHYELQNSRQIIKVDKELKLKRRQL